MTSLDYDQLNEALRFTWSAETERTLRLQLLWKQNHERRDGSNRLGEVSTSISEELHANLERLCELLDPESAPALTAEIHRELGEFRQVREILAEYGETVEPHVANLLRLIDAAARERSIAPFLIPPVEEEYPDFGRDELKQVVETEGLYPHPVIEDVVPFPTECVHRELDPALLIRLDTIDPQWEGWAPILDDGEREFKIAYNRAFTPGDRELYDKAIPEWKEELQWFWGRYHFDVDPSGPDGDRYFRTLYQIYYDYFYPESDFGFDLDTESYKLAFDDHFYGPDVQDEGDYYFLYWNVYWASFAGRIPSPNEETFPGVDAIRREIAVEERELRRRQYNAIDGLSYFERGGDPSWFQGLDQTPRIDGRPYEFVGQIWLDYINAGFRLVYLFFDPETRRTYQVYDYD